MITYHDCAQCGTPVLHDDGVNAMGMNVKKHPSATKYFKAKGKNIIEFYCSVECGLKTYEEERNGKT